MRTLFDLAEFSVEGLDLVKHHSESNNLELIKSNAFENNILMFLLENKATEVNHYDPQLEDLYEILALIGTELNN